MGQGLPAGPWIGLLVIALVTIGWRAFFDYVLDPQRVESSVRRIHRRLAPVPEAPRSLPIERIARNARRLRSELAHVPSGTPMARRQSLAGAYDDLLVDACRALGVPDTLSGMAPGHERDSERLHVEHELEEAGLVLTA